MQQLSLGRQSLHDPGEWVVPVKTASHPKTWVVDGRKGVILFEIPPRIKEAGIDLVERNELNL
jgi:hypothetical protein